MRPLDEILNEAGYSQEHHAFGTIRYYQHYGIFFSDYHLVSPVSQSKEIKFANTIGGASPFVNRYEVKPEYYHKATKPSCKRVSDKQYWSLFYERDWSTFGHVRIATFDFKNSKCIDIMCIIQFTSDNFGIGFYTDRLTNDQTMILRNALLSISINEQTPGVLQFPKSEMIFGAFTIKGSAQVIHDHLKNIINMIKTIEGSQVFGSDLEHELRNLIPTVVPSITPYKLLLAPPSKVDKNFEHNNSSDTSRNVDNQNYHELRLFYINKEIKRGFRLEQTASKCLKDQTKAAPEPAPTPLDPKNAQVVLYRKK